MLDKTKADATAGNTVSRTDASISRADGSVSRVDDKGVDEKGANRAGGSDRSKSDSVAASKVHGTSGQDGRARHLRPALRRLRTFLRILLPIAVIAAGMASFMYLKATAPEVKKRAKKERSFAVKTIVAQAGDYRPMLKLYGTTTSGRSVDIRALVAGQVVATGPGLREGGVVDKGQLLLSIDPFDFERAKMEAEAQTNEARAKVAEQQASLASEKATLKFSRERLKLSTKDLERAVPLARRGTVSNRTVDDRRNIVIQRRQTVEQLENSIRVWEARIAQQQAAIARLASVAERAERKLKETRLEAPFDAYVTQVGAQVGRIISANDKVAMLIDRKWIEVRFTLTDAQFGRIVDSETSLKGRKVKVLWSVGAKPLVYPATIERVGAQISADSGGIEVYARIDDPHKPVSLRPGAFTQVLVPDRMFTKVYRLPGIVLYNGNKVYVVVEGRLVARAVEQVGTSGDDVLLSGAIQPGDHIIATRLSTPGDGLLVMELGADGKAGGKQSRRPEGKPGSKPGPKSRGARAVEPQQGQ